MDLQITLVKTPGKVSLSCKNQTFNEQGGTLGRSDSNSWVLPDPDKFLSSCHCEILCDAGRYYILDLSTNGTFLNSSPEPLGKGVKAPLSDGDYFEIGDYRFSVSVIATQPFAQEPPFAVAQTPSSIDDIFGSPLPTGQSFADPFASSGAIPDDFSLEPGLETDPLAALDKLHGGSLRPDPLDNDQSLFGSSQDSFSTDNQHHSGGSQLDYSPGLDQSISWPDSNQENMIPEDWEDDLLGSGPLSDSPFASPPPAPPAREVNLEPVPVTPQPRPQRPVPPVREVAPPPEQTPAPEPVAPPPKPVKPVVESKPQASVNPASIDRRLVTAMGLDVSRLSDDQVNEISDMAGELMREIVDGMMQVLRSRTSIKNEFRMNVTTIQPVENNPLKFSVGVDDALENMFIKKTNAYKKPVEAFREGFQEIAEHQIAMIAGIRYGFERMMERFNPENLEKNFNKQGKGGVIPGMQKAKYWSSYAEYYAGFVDNMESSFQHLFGSDFVNAYEDQLRKLAAARKKK